MDIVDELLDKFAYTDLFANKVVHDAADEITRLREQVKHLETEVERLSRIAYG